MNITTNNMGLDFSVNPPKISSDRPQALWQYFYEISQIPRTSNHEEKIRQYLIDFAQKNDLTYFIDNGNILIFKDATLGSDENTVVALQAHMDMVGQKTADSNHDFLNDPIQLEVVGEFVQAKGTTLGADNGIGLASILAILTATNIEHGKIEALITSNEETGMDGAHNLTGDLLSAEYMINTDTEEVGEIYIGCAGGVDALLEFEFDKDPQHEWNLYQIDTTGLAGGHSGCDIHLNIPTAVRILPFLLSPIANEYKLQLAKLQIGSVRNAIARDGSATFYSPLSLDIIKESINEQIDSLRINTQGCENLVFSLKTLAKNDEIAAETISAEDSLKVLSMLQTIPNGVAKLFQQNLPMLVESSSSIGIVNLENATLEINSLIRSLSETEMQKVKQSLSEFHVKQVAVKSKIEFSGEYPGWEPEFESTFLNKVHASYSKFYPEVNINIIHAGLECGLIKKKYPTMQVVSIGPTILSPHSPSERVNIKSCDIYWQTLCDVIANLKPMYL